MKRAGKYLVGKFPYSERSDAAYFYSHFLWAHSRVPRRKIDLINDYFFFLKIDGSLSEAARQYTSDKIYVKDFVSAKIGSDHTPETFHILRTDTELDGFTAENPCVVKPAHLSGYMVRLRPGEAIPAEDRVELKAALRRNLYTENREANYKNLPARILVEDDIGKGLPVNDYKMFCYRGLPRFIQVDSDRYSAHKRNLYTPRWEQIPYAYNKPLGRWENAPSVLPRMLDIAQQLSREFESARIDLFVIGDRVLVGEITHCPEQAHGRFESREAEEFVSALYFANDVEN